MAGYEVDPAHRSNAGYEAALARAQRYGLPTRLEPDEDERVESALRTTRRLLPEDASDRYGVLLYELVTLAALSRIHYAEDPLDEDQIAAFIEHSRRFLNSWTHRRTG